MTNFHRDEAKKKFFFRKKKFKMADSKKLSFSTSSKAEQIPPKFHGFVLGLVGLNDAKGIDFAQPIRPWGCLTHAPKQAKNAFFVFFACFRPYVGQPDDHIGWASSISLPSIYLIHPRTNPWNFGKKILRIGCFEKLSFFLSQPSYIFSFFNQSQTVWQNGWDSIFMTIVVYRQKDPPKALLSQV